MKAAIVTAAGSTPVYGDFNAPVAADGEHRMTVSAAALSPVVKSRASGAHYSASSAFPFVVGIDGVGRLDDGRRVYFLLPRTPFGSMAEIAVAPTSNCVVLPDGLDDIAAAALANPGLSSWAAFKERARLKSGETVLINGATGTSGRLAVQIARCLGAARIVVTGRNAAALQSLGADVAIDLTDKPDVLDTAFREQFEHGIDVVLDYLWGDSAQRLLSAAAKVVPEGIPLRFVQVGHSSGATIALSAMVLRSIAIEMMGTGLGSVPLPRIIRTVEELFSAAANGGLRIATRPVPLAEVEAAWTGDSTTSRIVFTTGR